MADGAIDADAASAWLSGDAAETLAPVSPGGAGTVAQLPRSRYAPPALPAVLPRPSALSSVAPAHGSVQLAGEGADAQAAAADVPTVAPPARRGATRLESLLEIILQEQREQAERIGRLQVGIDHLNARLSSAEEVPALPALPALPVLAATPQQERAASPTAHAAALEALLRPASPRAATLVEIATEVALLNALSEVLVRHHEAAQSRAAAASARLQRAEAHAADIASVHALVRESPGESGSLVAAAPQRVGIAHDVLGSAAVQSYRDARAEARSAAARDAAVVARSRELLALSAGEGSARTRDVSSLEDHPLAAPPLLAASPPPRDHTPAAGGALVVRSERAASSVAAVRASTSGALRGLLDYAFSDADFASVLALLAAVGGNAGPAPASPQAIRALTELRLEGAAAQEACCPVCLADLGTACVKAMPCGSAHKPHAFHAHCIERWLAIRNSCPVCRCALAEPAVEEDAAAAEQSLQEQALLAVTHEQGPLTRLRFN